MNWFEKLIPPKIKSGSAKKGVPQGVWSKCEKCDAVLYNAELERNHKVCPRCGHHIRIGARTRLNWLLDDDSFTEIAAEIKPVDKFKFRDSKKYKDRINEAQKKTKESDALVVARGSIKGLPVVVAAFEFEFMGGSMGSVVGEKFVQGAMAAIEDSVPYVCFSASGGARMQEALFSLMQMAKTSAVLARLEENKLPFISILTDPTMGGVSASFAMLGDIIIAEPNALVGFAGPRVIEQTVRETLPAGFQRSEFLLDHGALDMIVDRRDMASTLNSLLSMMIGNSAASKESIPTAEAEQTLTLEDSENISAE